MGRTCSKSVSDASESGHGSDDDACGDKVHNESLEEITFYTSKDLTQSNL